MKKSFTLLFGFLLFAFESYAQSYIWAKSTGGPGGETTHSIAVDNSGNVYTTGGFSGTVDFDPGSGISNLTSVGPSNIFISKLDLAGNFVWAKRIGGIDVESAYAIAVDVSGNVYTSGIFEGTVDFDPGTGTSNLISAGDRDIFVSKLDTDGNFLWAKSMGGPSGDFCGSIAVDGSGNVLVTGDFEGTADFDPGKGTYSLSNPAGCMGVYIVKLDANGNFVWAKNMDGTYFGVGQSIAVDGTGNVYTTGSFMGTADFDPGVGTSNLTSVADGDVFILKLDPAGNFIWVKSIGGPLNDVGESIAVDGSGNVYTTGWFWGGADFDPGPGIYNITSVGSADSFISKLDAAGNLVWAKSLSGTSFASGQSIAVDDLGRVYTSGRFYDTVDFDPGVGTNNLTSAGSIDIFISILDASGNFGWATSIGDNNQDHCRSIVVDGSGNIYTAGWFWGTADFDPGVGISNLSSVGWDGFVLKLGSTTVDVLENKIGSSLKVYPNPTKGHLMVDLGTSYDNVTVTIRNQLGQDVLKKSYSNSKQFQVNIPGSAGVYFVEVSSGDNTATHKVVKE